MEHYEFRRDDGSGLGKSEPKNKRSYQLTRIERFFDGSFKVQRSKKRFSYTQMVLAYRLIRMKTKFKLEDKQPLKTWQELIGEIESQE